MTSVLIVLGIATVVLAVLYAFVRGAREEGMRRRRDQMQRDQWAAVRSADRLQRKWQARREWEVGEGPKDAS